MIATKTEILSKRIDKLESMLKTIIDLLDRRDALAGMQSLESSIGKTENKNVAFEPPAS
ncbi:MAG: hypothetical protein KGL39_10845 [Patescibacteria group bacterium]|nr:hypothetical protein [Patescibacteria group bacterium]